MFAKFGKLAIKIWLPFNFAKKLKDRHFVVAWSKNFKLSTNICFVLAFKKNVLSNFFLFSSVCYQDNLSDSGRNEIASSAARNFNNKSLFKIKIKNVSCFYFWNKSRQKGQNFQFFKGQFLGNSWPHVSDFWRVFGDLCEASNKYKFTIFFKI